MLHWDEQQLQAAVVSSSARAAVVALVVEVGCSAERKSATPEWSTTHGPCVPSDLGWWWLCAAAAVAAFAPWQPTPIGLHVEMEAGACAHAVARQ